MHYATYHRFDERTRTFTTSAWNGAGKSILFVVVTLMLCLGCSKESLPLNSPIVEVATYPDYSDGLTIPVNIAPLNFDILTPHKKAVVTIEGSDSAQRRLFYARRGCIQFPEKKWQRLLSTQEKIKVTIHLLTDQGWRHAESFTLTVSADSIDYGVVYRRVAPGYETYSSMGIYCRELSSFKEHALIENSAIPGNCVNCHSFQRNNPQSLSLHVRGRSGATLILFEEALRRVNTKRPETGGNCVYPAWHPTAPLIAYSVNATTQEFHAAQKKPVEVMDSRSDIVVMDVERDTFFSTPLLMQDSLFETYPTFSPDGKNLLFCQASIKPLTEYNTIRYNLCRIAFDAETHTFGDKIDTLFMAETIGKSVAFPRVEPNGKRILFTLSDYGTFPIWHAEADLYTYNCDTREVLPAEDLNSSETDSYHAWSGTGRWVCFSSRRQDGVYTRLYLAHVNADGTFSPPFLLPQHQPYIFDTENLTSFNVPEFTTEPLPVSPLQLRSAL